MKRVLIEKFPTPDHPVPLPDDEAHHLLQVLRIRNGERVEALDGCGSKMSVEIEWIGKGKALAHSRGESVRDSRLNALPIILEMAVLKGDAMEWTVEKAVELGVKTFIPVLCAHGVVQIDRKGPLFYRDRWQKIADQALKQCGRLERMEVREPTPLELLLTEKRSNRIWADETRTADSIPLFDAKKNEIAILIGPEGGWSENERLLLSRSDCRPTSLGPWIYRAETAALFATSLAAASMR